MSTFEDGLSEMWTKYLARDARAFRTISAFWRIVQNAGEKHGAYVILIDLGPNLGTINRAALIASNFVVIPLGPDPFSLQGLQNLGAAFRRWRDEWQERLDKNPISGLNPPPGARLKNYRSLMPLAQEARKPMFFLKPADGALGAHTYAVTEAYKDFRNLAIKIAANAGLKALS